MIPFSMFFLNSRIQSLIQISKIVTNIILGKILTVFTGFLTGGGGGGGSENTNNLLE